MMGGIRQLPATASRSANDCDRRAPDAAVNGNTAQGLLMGLTESGGSWSRRRNYRVDGDASNEFGTSVSIQGDTASHWCHSTAAGPGAAYVSPFRGTWTQAANLCKRRLRTFGDASARRKQTPDWRNKPAVEGNRDQGAAFVFTIKGAPGPSAYLSRVTALRSTAWFVGCARGLDGAGRRAGRHRQRSQQGAATFYGKAAEAGTRQKLTAKRRQYLDDFGSSVALSGATALIGALSTTVRNRQITYSRSQTTREQRLNCWPVRCRGRRVGWSAALRRSTALIGAWGAAVNGISARARVFLRAVVHATPTPYTTAHDTDTNGNANTYYNATPSPADSDTPATPECDTYWHTKCPLRHPDLVHAGARPTLASANPLTTHQLLSNHETEPVLIRPPIRAF